MVLAQVNVLTNFLCNMHCLMCNLPPFANPDTRWTLDELGASFKGLEGSLEVVSVSGGESTLREDLLEICQFLFGVLKEGVDFAIVTNGYLTERIEALIDSFTPEQRARFFVALSMDGLEQTHDKIRIKGSFENLMKTIEIVDKKSVPMGVNMCIQPLNYLEVMDVYRLVKSKNICFSAGLAQPYEFYDFTPDMIESIDRDLKEITGEIETDCLDNKIQHYYLSHIVPHFRNGKRQALCCAGEEWVILDPFGEVYPCHKASWNVKGEYGNPELSFGNIKTDGTLLEIHQSAEADLVREKMDIVNCNACWGCDIGVNPHIKEILNETTPHRN